MSTPLAAATMLALAQDAGRDYNVPVPLILAVARHESAFNPAARRGEAHLADASHGLMQLLLSTARGLGYTGSPGAWNPLTGRGTGLYDPVTNIGLGTRLLRQLLNQTNGDIARTLSAYNAGLGNAKRATVQTRFCEVWKPTAPTTGRVLDRDCARIRTVYPGEYPNQPYVDAVTRHLIGYGGSLSMPARYVPTVGGGGDVGPAGGAVPPGSSSSPSGTPSVAFVVRPAVAVLLAAGTAIFFLWQRLGGR